MWLLQHVSRKFGNELNMHYNRDMALGGENKKSDQAYKARQTSHNQISHSPPPTQPSATPPAATTAWPTQAFVEIGRLPAAYHS